MIVGARDMRTIVLVALHVFRDSVRDKVLYSIVAFAVLLMAASYLIGQLTAGQDLKIIKDLGLAAMSLFGLFIAVFIGIGLIAREIERRSIFALLAKPVRRHEFIVGKYLGLVGTLLANLAVMAVAYYAVLAYMGWVLPPAAIKALPTAPTDPRLLLAIAMIACELSLVTALALFWSTFSSSALLSAALTIGIYVAGQFGADLRNLEQVVDSPAAAWLGRALYYLLPNFAAFDIKAQVVHALPVEPEYLVLTAGYAAVYITLLLVASILMFSRRDFK
jgi:ABC-type transport system involved in multi-copper enzyme maturation permease subunit